MFNQESVFGNIQFEFMNDTCNYTHSNCFYLGPYCFDTFLIIYISTSVMVKLEISHEQS